MSDYIKREDAIEIIARHDDTDGTIKVFSGRFVNGLISAIPPADVRENVRGEWLPHPNKQNKEWDVCSACGIGCKRREFGIHANGDKWVTEYNFPFCPNCGADMRPKS